MARPQLISTALVALVALAVGFLLAGQVKAQLLTPSNQVARNQALVRSVQDLETRNEGDRQQIAALRDQINTLEAQAAGKVSRSAVQSFYDATLPQLGWTSAGANAWRREGELLRLDFHGQDGALTVGFSLSPL